ncbi:MAG: hypothetical protein II974_11365 [Firmicutes bacterium]|nr:hypothetical protein [Bacillota bacterium]MBR0440988.1 hypothetical protein [Bacillota bacterium]
MVRVTFEAEGRTKTYSDPCIEDFDLERIVMELDQVYDGREDRADIYMDEPYFYISCRRNKRSYDLTLSFDVWDGAVRIRTISVTENMDRRRLGEIIDGFEDLADIYTGEEAHDQYDKIRTV